RELDAREADRRHLREGARNQGLGQAREVLDQDVAVGEEAQQHELERFALADDRSLDLLEDPVGTLRELLDRHSSSSLATAAPSASGSRPPAKRLPGGSRSGRTTSHSCPPSASSASESSSSWIPRRSASRCSATSRRIGR